MAGLIIYLYEKGYHNFLFFVNATNIIEKTKINDIPTQFGKINLTFFVKNVL